MKSFVELVTARKCFVLQLQIGEGTLIFFASHTIDEKFSEAVRCWQAQRLNTPIDRSEPYLFYLTHRLVQILALSILSVIEIS